MHKLAKPAISAVNILILVTACQGATYKSPLYFDQMPPGDMPVVFAPDIISKPDRFEQFLLFSPDGRGLTFGVTNEDWSEFSLLYMKRENGAWSDPIAAPFLGDDPSALTSCFAYEGGKAFFTAARPSYPPSDIWVSASHDGEWSIPEKMPPPISSKADEFEVHISKAGTLYFSSAREGGHGDLDIYRAPLAEGKYPAAENLGAAVNTSAGDDLPFVAPDESFLIFASDRPGGLGHRDLYVSFQIDGAWSAAESLGPNINSEYWDIYPSLSPDGKYLFFTRRQAWQATEDSDIYWVSADFIDRLRSSAAAH